MCRVKNPLGFTLFVTFPLGIYSMSLSKLVQQIRTDRNLTTQVPDFDPNNGNESAKYLFLLEAPGPRAVVSGKISFDNQDPTAANFREQLSEAGVARADIVIWNIVPWYIGNPDSAVIRAAGQQDINEGITYLKQLLSCLPQLKCIVLVGGAAKRAHLHLSSTTTARLVCCHHPSARVMNVNPNASQENIEIFRLIQTTT